MPTQYIVAIVGGDERDRTPMNVLTSRIIELEKLQEARMQVAKNVRIQQWNITLWSQQKNLEKQFSFGDYVMWFPKGNKSHLEKFTKKWFGPCTIQYVLPNDIVLLVTVEKFETNPMLVNVNKFKPYKYMESKVQKKEQQMLIYWEKTQVEFKMQILTHRRRMKDVNYKNHR